MFKPKTVVYLANSYSSKKSDPELAALERAHRRSLESYIGTAIKRIYGVTPILPIAQSSAMVEMGTLSHGFEDWESDDFTLILKSDEMWVLISDGWRESTGVQAEIKFALEQKIPVKYLCKETLQLLSHEDTQELLLAGYKI